MYEPLKRKPHILRLRKTCYCYYDGINTFFLNNIDQFYQYSRKFCKNNLSFLKLAVIIPESHKNRIEVAMQMSRMWSRHAMKHLKGSIAERLGRHT